MYQALSLLPSKCYPLTDVHYLKIVPGYAWLIGFFEHSRHKRGVLQLNEAATATMDATFSHKAQFTNTLTHAANQPSAHLAECLYRTSVYIVQTMLSSGVA